MLLVGLRLMTQRRPSGSAACPSTPIAASTPRRPLNHSAAPDPAGLARLHDSVSADPVTGAAGPAQAGARRLPAGRAVRWGRLLPAGLAQARLGPKGAPLRLGPDQDLLLCSCASLRRGTAESLQRRRLVQCACEQTDDGLYRSYKLLS